MYTAIARVSAHNQPELQFTVLPSPGDAGVELSPVGERGQPTGLTVGVHLTRRLEGKHSLRPSTRVSYHGHLRLYLTPGLGDLRLVDLRPHHIATVYSHMMGNNQGRSRPLGATTLRRCTPP